MNDFLSEEELRIKKEKGPYDFTLEETITMYDNMPYERDINICNKDYIKLNSGNIIKSFRCKIGDKINI